MEKRYGKKSRIVVLIALSVIAFFYLLKGYSFEDIKDERKSFVCWRELNQETYETHHVRFQITEDGWRTLSVEHIEFLNSWYETYRVRDYDFQRYDPSARDYSETEKENDKGWFLVDSSSVPPHIILLMKRGEEKLFSRKQRRDDNGAFN